MRGIAHEKIGNQRSVFGHRGAYEQVRLSPDCIEAEKKPATRFLIHTVAMKAFADADGLRLVKYFLSKI